MTITATNNPENLSLGVAQKEINLLTRLITLTHTHARDHPPYVPVTFPPHNGLPQYTRDTPRPLRLLVSLFLDETKIYVHVS